VSTTPSSATAASNPLNRPTPTDTVVDVRRGDEWVAVTLSDDPMEAWTFTGTTTPSGDETPTRYITEQLYGRPVVRNAFAHFEDGVEEVVVRATAPSSPPPEGHATNDGATYHVESDFVTSG
jgi:hypothetical protein